MAISATQMHPWLSANCKASGATGSTTVGQKPRRIAGEFRQYQGQRPVQGNVPSSARPAYPGYAPPAETPPGHLGAWLNDHRNLPVKDQERILPSEPSFKRIPAADQQRFVQQLHQVNQLSGELRQLRLACMENLEQMSPQERIQINLSQRRWATLPPERQTPMKSALHSATRVRFLPNKGQRYSTPNAIRASSVPRSEAPCRICCAWSLTNPRGKGLKAQAKRRQWEVFPLPSALLVVWLVNSLGFFPSL